MRMDHSSVASASKTWHTIVIVLIISCRFCVTLSDLDNRFHRERNTENRNQEPAASTGGQNLHDLVMRKLSIPSAEGKQIGLQNVDSKKQINYFVSYQSHSQQRNSNNGLYSHNLSIYHVNVNLTGCGKIYSAFI